MGGRDRRGSATAFHARELTDPVPANVTFFEPDGPALVLGSSQPIQTADLDRCRRRGVEVVVRRSGGGAVLVVPGETLWFDIELPVGHERLDADVGRSMWWIGDRVAEVLNHERRIAAADGPVASVHTGALVHSPWSRLVCFAGLGPGEVTMAGRKVFGVSQRRTRAGARFQCMVLVRWDPAALLDLLARPAQGDDPATPPFPTTVDLEPLGGGVDLDPSVLQRSLRHAFAAP
ncbi:MAG: hypothetical protein R2705_04145 [Ilumatobacteraceae bacterium]